MCAQSKLIQRDNAGGEEKEMKRREGKIKGLAPIAPKVLSAHLFSGATRNDGDSPVRRNRMIQKGVS
jgi:hypothetical protein